MHRKPAVPRAQAASGPARRSGVNRWVVVIAIIIAVVGFAYAYQKSVRGAAPAVNVVHQMARGRVPQVAAKSNAEFDDAPPPAGKDRHVADIAAPDHMLHRVTPAPPVQFLRARKVEYPRSVVATTAAPRDPDADPAHSDARADARAASTSDFRGVKCPPYDAGIAALQIPLKHLPRKIPTSVSEKYDRRANNCASHGIWNKVRIDDHHKILHHIVRLGGIKPGSFVLDWGSGCGHSLQFLVDEYNVHGVGIDVSNKTIEYARNSTSKRNMHCVADGTRLQFLPSNTFDHVLSFGSIYHVYNRTLFCHVLRQLVRVVRVGGTIYNGWTENGEYHRKHVELCFGDLPVKATIHEEADAFKDVEIFPLKAQQDKPNTYSLVLEKTGAISDDMAAMIDDVDRIPIECGVHKCDVRGSGVALSDTKPPGKPKAQVRAATGDSAGDGQHHIKPLLDSANAVVTPQVVAKHVKTPPKRTKPLTTVAPQSDSATTKADGEQDEQVEDVTTRAPSVVVIKKRRAAAVPTAAPPADDGSSGDSVSPQPSPSPVATATTTTRPAARSGFSDNSGESGDGAPPRTTKSSRKKAGRKPAALTTVASSAARPKAEGSSSSSSSSDKGDKVSAAVDSAVATPLASTVAGWAGTSLTTCPPYDPAIEELQIPLKHLPRGKKTSVAQKYDRRANNCKADGVWHKVTLDDHKKILRVIVKLLQIPDVPADPATPLTVFDWGSGCGHKLHFLSTKYGVRGFGIDVSNKTIEYATENTNKLNMYCVADGTKLSWIPTDSFDRAFSFGSVYHVYNKDVFCRVLREMVRITKPGGFIYNGWTENAEYKRKDIDECLKQGDWMTGAERNTVTVLEEATTFVGIETFPLKANQKKPNTYSVLIQKAQLD